MTLFRTIRVFLVLFICLLAIGNAHAIKPSERTTIVDVAMAVNAGDLDPALTGEFSALLAALEGTGLDMPLDGNGQYTVFAPTDAAFAAIGFTPEIITATTGTTEGKALFTEILLYHVARGERFSGDVLDAERIRMLNGDFTYPKPINITIEDNVGEEAILIPGLIDISADNGVIHVVNKVLKPQPLN